MAQDLVALQRDLAAFKRRSRADTGALVADLASAFKRVKTLHARLEQPPGSRGQTR